MHLGCVCPSLQGIVRASIAYPENTLGARSTYGGGGDRPKGIGDLIRAALTLPENTVENAAARSPNLGCACSRGFGVARSGMGDLSQVWNDLTTGGMSIGSLTIPYWALAAGGAAVLFMFVGGGRPSGYKEAVARVKKSYPTTVGRIRRAASAF